MKYLKILSIVIILSLLIGCSGPGSTSGTPTPKAVSPNPTNNQKLPTPAVFVTNPPDPQSGLRDFLEAWKMNDYSAMYASLTQENRNNISLEQFTARYQDSLDALTLKDLVYQIGTDQFLADSVQTNFHVDYHTNSFGNFSRDMTATLKLENGRWRVSWDDGLIMPELKGGSVLKVDYNIPVRGNIFDRNGKPLSQQTDAIALGVIPVQIVPETEGTLLGLLSALTGNSPSNIMARYDDKRAVDWYVPVGEAKLEDVNRFYTSLINLGGVVMSQYNSRFYNQEGIAPQVIGYVSPVPKEQLSQFLRNGYSPAGRFGQAGIEKWGEQYLSGKTGGTLYLIDKDGKVTGSLGQVDAKPASTITLTIDQDLQMKAQKAIAGFRGSIVVMERNSGRVLAMVSSPTYNPNLFDPNNVNSAYALGELLGNTETPLLNRAAQGQYPLGSVFKVITFSAALESGTYTPKTPFYCGYDFTELSDRVLHDWTWDHFQDELIKTGEGKTRPSGDLDLSGALMRSCNPYFWHIGLDLYNQGRISAVADMARGFGLGSPTGIGQIDEAAGTIINPPALLDAVNQAIGQGDVLVTPLQVANFMAAIGNGGTLYRPQIVEKITDLNGVDTTAFKPESRGVLPMRPETLAALRAAMLSVIRNKRGTAYQRFTNLTIPVYGKTGTAETNTGIPHAWFAGYTDANNAGLPDIAVAVIAENAGEGSVIAAPIFKRIVEIYFYGQARTPYSWETSIGVTRTPTLPVTDTPSP